MKRFGLVLFLAALVPLSASANTYRVTNTNDWFWGSLRQAIEDANGHAGADTITFAIGSGPRTIHLESELPIITDPVTIDGFTQPGATLNPIIEIDGFGMPGRTGILVAAPGTTIRGLVITRFGGNGIGVGEDFLGHVPSGTVIQGCWIGVGLDGATQKANGRDGIRVYANDVVIGGEGRNRNVIAGNGVNGISIGKHPWTGQSGGGFASRTRVQGNFIGVTANGISARPNSGAGIEIVSGNDNVIGGDTAALGNVISANGKEGILLDDPDTGTPSVARTIIKNNRIGVSNNGSPMGNGRAGITAFAPQSTITQNVIANNGLAGVFVRVHRGTHLFSNSMTNNAGLGIDLASYFDSGVTPNDDTDADNGANGYLNFPVINDALTEAPYTRVRGFYRGAPNQTFTLDFYKNGSCDPSGYGEGENYLGSTYVSTPASGYVYYSVLVPWAGLGTYITATARDAGSNTSEFSLCRQVTFPGPVISAVSPVGGRIGTPFTITGSNFTFVNSVTFFDGANYAVRANFTINNDTTITATVPRGAKPGQIMVSSPYGTAMSNAFFLVTPPTGDMNADGKPDLVWRNYATGENWIAVTGGGIVPITPVADLQWQIQGTGDFDNDGNHDIVWRHYGSGATRIWLMRGTQYLGRDLVLPSVPDPNWHISAVGDFDGDGDPDLVWRNTATGKNTVWIMNGGTLVAAPALPDQPLAWTLEAAGDFNLDGATDLLWRDYTTGQNLIWQMNGTTFTGFTTSLPSIPDPNWIIEAAVDWDQDGDLDIVWRNITGPNVVWRLIGAFWDGSSVTVLAPDTNSEVRIEDY